MPEPIHNLGQLIDVLKDNIDQNPDGLDYIVLDGNLFIEAGIFVAFLGSDSLTITQRDREQKLLVTDATSARLIGVAPLFSTIKYDVEWIGTVPPPAGPPRLTMTATPAADQDWSFAKEFPDLPPYTGSDDGVLVEKPSFFNTAVINEPEFTVSTYADQATKLVRGLSLAGELDATKGDLAPIAVWVPNAAQLALTGTIAVRSGAYPLIDFTAAVELSLPKMGAVVLALGTVATPSDPDAPGASTIAFAGTVSIPNLKPITISAPLLQGDSVWAFTVAFEEGGLTLSNLAQLAEFVSNYPLTLPPGLDVLNWIALQELVVGIVPPASPTEALLPSIQSVGVKVGTTQKWDLPIPGVSIGDLATEWIVLSPGDEPTLDGQVMGTIYLGRVVDAPRLMVKIDLPDVASEDSGPIQISADLDPRFPVRLGQVFYTFTGGAIDIDLNVSQLDLLVTPSTRELYVYCLLDGDWDLFPQLKFDRLNFYIEYSPNSLVGAVTAAFKLAKVGFGATALYRGSGKGWHFSGGLLPGQTIPVAQFLANLLGGDGWPGLPQSVASLQITKLQITLDSLTRDNSFAMAVEWKPEFAGRKWDVAADFLFETKHVDEQTKHSGHVAGAVKVDRFSVAVAYEFAVKNAATLTFRIGYKNLTLTCTLTKNDKDQNILTASLGGVTFGGIVEYLVNLVDPNLGFSLSTPWDVLNEISFDNLKLTVNLATKDVGITYKLDKNLGIADIDTIGLTYVNKAGRRTVDISITGRFLDEKYDDDDPLEWDLLNDPPPTPAGKGPAFLDLRYLGVGQNVGFRETKNFKNVQDVIKALKSDFKPVEPDQQKANPLDSPLLKNLKFAGDGRWLIGADMTFIGAVSISVVFNDPALYGLRVALSGEKVKSFAGLEFEILYKKVTDTIGVYHIELTVPEAFRQIQLGAVSLTLPIITIDIYTNGNFRIDLGFPVGLDFSRSFCVQAGPFIGFGGFYFALLDGSTSERIPRITNGNFSPVIEAGIALQVGVGRSINKGMISAGASITMVTVIEGVFGWFNPNDASAGSALYYWVRGNAAVVGKIYGKVDFVVVQADISITAYAEITLTIEAYEAIQLELTVFVEVSVSIKILFIRVNFSFSTRLDLSMTIGSSSTPPWIVDASTPPPLMLRQQIAPHGRRRLSGAALQRRLLGALEDTGKFNWDPVKLFPTIQTVGLSLAPALTVAAPELVFATRAAAPGAQGPELQVVMSLFAPNSVPPQARRANEVRMLATDAPAQTPFNLLVTGMLKWALHAYTRSGPLGDVPQAIDYALASDLEAISKYLHDPNNWQSAFTYARLAELMKLNYVLAVSTPLGPTGLNHPDGPLPFDADAPEVSAALFPMIPNLQMAVPGRTPVKFWDYHCIDRDYEDALAAYYDQLRVPIDVGGPRGARPTGPSGLGTESLSTFVFRDYFSMVAKGAVNSAIDLLKAYPYEPTGAGPSGPSGPPESLASIAEQFVGATLAHRTRRGETIGTLAGRFGLSPHAVQFANPHLARVPHRDALPPGTLVTVNTGVTPEAIAAANPGYPLHPGRMMTISGVKHQVKAPGGRSENLAHICASYGITGPATATVFTFEPKPGEPNPNVGNPGLLQPGAAMTIPPQTFHVISPLDDSKLLVAALFYVRSLGPARPEQTPWYAYRQFYEQWMQDNPGPSGPTFWDVPLVTQQPDGSLDVIGRTQYAPQGTGPMSPDTPALAAGYFAMAQLQPGPVGASFPAFQNLVSLSGPRSYAIKQFPYTVQPGDSVGGVAQRFGVPVPELVTSNAGATGLMQPLSVLALPTIDYHIKPRDTLASVAADFDLPLDDLAESVKGDPGILHPYAPTGPSGTGLLTVPDVPGRNSDVLLDDLVKFGRFNDISGLVTRFMLHGMRVPAPGSQSGKTFPPGTPLWSLYEMTGQQFPVGPTGPLGQLDIVFSKGATADWICLDAPTGPSAPAPGPSVCKDAMTVPLGTGFFHDPPSLTLSPSLLAGPTALPLYRDAPFRYAMPESIHWQAAASPTLPGPTATTHGQPSIWNFPQTLLEVARGTTGTQPYELALPRRDNGSANGDDNNFDPVANYCWASAIDLRIQRVPGAAAGQYLSNSYLLLGADQNGRDRLLNAFMFLRERRLPPPQGQLYVLYPPSATSSNAKGLVSDPLDPVQTFLLKSNLTTVTQSNVRALVEGLAQPSGVYYARLEAIPEFLTLAWEASITGSGGFYLNYVNANGGGGLPDVLFANGNVATITLLLLARPQLAGTDRSLYSFNNCALVGDSIDSGASHPFARVATPTPADLVRTASVPAGRAGFYMVGRNPEPPKDAPVLLSPEDRTRSLYNLLGFRLAANQDFAESNQSLPIGPVDTPLKGVSGPTGPDAWWYHRVLPVYRFGKVNDTPASAALPAVAENPYAGITGPTGLGGRPLSSARIDLGYHDVYGNHTLTIPPLAPVTVPIGYIDDLIGVAAWPGAAADFLFRAGPHDVLLDLRLSLQVDRYAPSGSYGFAQSRNAAVADADRYAQIFYQVQQKDVAFALASNLGAPAASAAALQPPSLRAAMTAFVSKAKVFADAAAAQLQRRHVTAGSDTLGAIAATYAVTAGMLVAENADKDVADVFQGKVVHPSLAVAAPMNTLKRLAADQVSTPFPPVCGPGGPPDCEPLGGFRYLAAAAGAAAPPTVLPRAPLDDLTVAELLSNNQTAPLTPGIVLRTLARTDPLPSDVANTLAAVAAKLRCVVYDLIPEPDTGPGGAPDVIALPVPIGLFADNYTAADVVAPNLAITIDGKTVSTGNSPTFQSVQAAFAALGLDVGTTLVSSATGDFVVKLENWPGIFAPSAKLVHADFVVPEPPPAPVGPPVPVFSIDNLPPGCGTIDELARLNAIVANFFYAGTPIYLSSCCYQPEALDTFTKLAEKFNVTLDQLARYNATAPLRAGVELLIPNLTYLPDRAAAYAPYSPTSGDSLDSIAGKFTTSAPVLGDLNANLPGIFADGVSIVIGGRSFPPGPADSLASAARWFGMEFATFIADVAPKDGLYRTNGVVLAPLPRVPATPAVLSELATHFNILPPAGASNGVVSLLGANRSLDGFLRAGAFLSGPDGTTPLEVHTHDTVDSILRRFKQDQYKDVSLDQLARANAPKAALLTSGRLFLLPSSPTEAAGAIAPVVPPAGATGESAIVFPVNVALEMTRSPGLVAPDFRNAPAVHRVTSVLAPRGVGATGGTLGLDDFAHNFEAAFGAHRLKCAVAQRDTVADPKETGKIWAVNFGPLGVSRFAVDTQKPEFYSLAPLSTKLLTGTFRVRPYESGHGLGKAVDKKFDAVDLDAWMAQFLSTIDLFLTAPYAVPAFDLGSGPAAPLAPVARAFAPAPAPDGPVGLAGRPGVPGIAAPDGALALAGCTGMTGADGPGNYDDIVTSKQTIAGELRRDVVPILKGVGATAGYYATTAKETLYQQMLVRLSNAYDVNAVVQYPVDVVSPCITPTGLSGPFAPRVSMKLVPDFYVGPTGVEPGTLAEAADYFKVSRPFLARTIADVQGLLLRGKKVQFDGADYPIEVSDTINTVAAHFDVPTDPNAPDYWEKWTAFADEIATQLIVQPGASYPVSKIARPVAATDTLNIIAEFFGADAATTGESNQSLPDIFVEQTLNLQGYEPYRIKAGDTLASIAAALRPTPPTVPVLADLLATRANLLNPARTLYFTQALPDVTISSSKVSLGPVGNPHGLAPALSFLFSLKHPGQFKKVFLNLKCVLDEVEYAIRAVPGVPGYQASSWLSLVLPIGSGRGTDVEIAPKFGQVQIPIPLRSYPVPPSLVAQSGLPSAKGPPPDDPAQAIAHAKAWDYRLDFRSANSAQDTDYVEARFNVPSPTGPSGPMLSLARTDLVFAALAEFIDAYPQLSADLARLPKLMPGQADRVASVAVQVLDIFAALVACALRSSFVGPLAGALEPLRYLYRVRPTVVGEQFSELHVGQLEGPTGAGALSPAVFAQSITGFTGGTAPDVGFLPLTARPPVGMTTIYDYPSGFTASVPLTQRFRFASREVIRNQDAWFGDIIRNQNAWGGIYLTRNEDLISSGPLGAPGTGPTGPSRAIPTDPAFLYQTPLVRFIDPTTPYLVDDTEIDVAGLTGPLGPPPPAPRTLAAHIENMLDAVLELGPGSSIKTDSYISLVCSYGFPVAGQTAGALKATTPICLVPTQLLTAAGKTAFAADLSHSIKLWPGWSERRSDAVLIMDLSVFRAADGGQVKPILEIRNLQIPIKAISDTG